MTKRLSTILALLILAACGGDKTLVANEQLSSVLAISNVVKREIRDDGLLTGVVVDVDLHNTGLLPIEHAFDVTWTMSDSDGSRVAADTVRVQRLPQSEVKRLVFTLAFSARASLSGYRDGVAFDFVEPPGE